MAISDFFKGRQYREESERLTKQVEQMSSLLTPEMQEVVNLQTKIDSLVDNQKAEAEKLDNLIERSSLLKHEIEQLNETIASKKNELIWLDDEILVQEFGLYKPQYEFASSLGYKEKLAEVRSLQKELIKSKSAVSGSASWTVNGSATQGKKMVSDTQKLLLRAFNSECDELISKVKYTNFDMSLKKIYKSAETISKLGATMSISIQSVYLEAKVKELCLAFEYQQKKQQEKEEQRVARCLLYTSRCV